jgi:proteic killer suppression protein
MIRVVKLSRRAEKDLAVVPRHVTVKLQDWVEDVEMRGLENVRKTPGYHDEPLKGALQGVRSIRLSRAYRAYYRQLAEAQVEFVRIERVDKHEY